MLDFEDDLRQPGRQQWDKNDPDARASD